MNQAEKDRRIIVLLEVIDAAVEASGLPAELAHGALIVHGVCAWHDGNVPRAMVEERLADMVEETFSTPNTAGRARKRAN